MLLNIKAIQNKNYIKHQVWKSKGQHARTKMPRQGQKCRDRDKSADTRTKVPKPETLTLTLTLTLTPNPNLTLTLTLIHNLQINWLCYRLYPFFPYIWNYYPYIWNYYSLIIPHLWIIANLQWCNMMHGAYFSTPNAMILVSAGISTSLLSLCYPIAT